MIRDKKNSFKIVCVAVAALLVSCAPHNSASVDQASQNLTQALGCGDMKSFVFDAFYEMIDQSQSVPTPQTMKDSLYAEMEQMKVDRNLTAPEASILNKITLEFFNVIDLMLTQTPDMTAASWKEQIQKMIEYEMQDQSSAETLTTQKQIFDALDRVSALAAQTSVNCSMSYAPTKTGPAPTPTEVAQTGLTKGINRIFATAYQSCRVLDLPAMDKATSDVDGITRLAQTHPDGIGGKRVISDLKSVQNTHYYIKGTATESSCARVADNPLIYDYGGSPAISGMTLNYFKNAGSGTEALGVDCSAFVSSAIAVVGMRYKPGLENKPVYTRQSSSKFIDAVKSGFTCFDNVTVNANQSVKAGDIVGVSGHVVIVDRIGADPFGLSMIKKESECSTLEYKNFNMDVAQSSPSKDGIGLNKFKLSDYLDETSKMRTAFVEMGKQACLAKFKNISIKPSSSAWGFLRHKGTSECLAPRVSLTGETCAQRCF